MIAYVNLADGHIYTVSSDGTRKARLTTKGCVWDWNRPMVWSPDGSKVAFAARWWGRWTNQVLDVEATRTSKVGRRASSRLHSRIFSWSPDGARLVATEGDHGTSRLVLLDAGSPSVTHTLVDEGAEPAWAPDGLRIAYSSGMDGQFDIYTVAPDGSARARLTTEGGFEPSWSPSGDRIAFTSARTGSRRVYVMAADGSGQTCLTGEAEFDYDPWWLPDGRRLAFLSSHGRIDVYTMGTNGEAPAAMPRGLRCAGLASWSPDATHIALVPFDDYNIHVMAADGSDLHRVTDEGSCVGPVWVPDGKLPRPMS